MRFLLIVTSIFLFNKSFAQDDTCKAEVRSYKIVLLEAGYDELSMKKGYTHGIEIEVYTSCPMMSYPITMMKYKGTDSVFRKGEVQYYGHVGGTAQPYKIAIDTASFDVCNYDYYLSDGFSEKQITALAKWNVPGTNCDEPVKNANSEEKKSCEGEKKCCKGKKKKCCRKKKKKSCSD